MEGNWFGLVLHVVMLWVIFAGMVAMKKQKERQHG
jgi:hypothetical protein